MDKFILESLFYFAVAVGISFVISFFAYKKKSLSLSGFYASMIIGTTVIWCGGWYYTIVLLFFFVSSSLLSRLSKDEKVDSLRSYKQVFANGLIGSILAVLYFIYEDEIFTILFTLSFAISTADTWASEIGKLAKSKPRNIITWRTMEVGLSGGITILGTSASFIGSVLIGAFYQFHPVIIVGGFLGSIVDSILGTWQIKYVTTSGQILEHPPKQEEFKHTTGLRFLSNNMVNFISNALVVTIVFFFLWYRSIE